MATFIQAPHPQLKSAIELPDADFGNGRASEATVQIKRTMLGRIITYPKSSDRQTLRLTFLLTRKKDLQLIDFLLVYQSAELRLELHNDTIWAAKLAGREVPKTGVGAHDNDNQLTGDETVRVTLVFSAVELT